MITVIGIGNKAGELTDVAKAELLKANCVVVRTMQSSAGKQFLPNSPLFALLNKKVTVIGLDSVYTEANDFNELNKSIAEKVLAAAAEFKRTVYCVDGDGYSDSSVMYLSKIIQMEIIPGIAFHAGKEPCTACLNMTAYDCVTLNGYLDTNIPLFISGLDHKLLASEVKLQLMKFYGDETSVVLSVGATKHNIPLYQMDMIKGLKYDSCLYVPAQESFNKEKYHFSDLMRILQRLTAPDGCPWDAEQTHESIRMNMIEEAYEAVDAVDSGDLDAMVEEFGDVLLQSILNCNIAERADEFDTVDMTTQLAKKLISRHVHVFGNVRAENAGAALNLWEQEKAKEKKYCDVFNQLSRLPENFPATLKLSKAVKKLCKAGVITAQTLENECNQTLANFTGEEDDGKALFAAACLLALKGKDAEILLNARVRDFMNKAQEQGKNL